MYTIPDSKLIGSWYSLMVSLYIYVQIVHQIFWRWSRPPPPSNKSQEFLSSKKPVLKIDIFNFGLQYFPSCPCSVFIFLPLEEVLSTHFNQTAFWPT